MTEADLSAVARIGRDIVVPMFHYNAIVMFGDSSFTIAYVVECGAHRPRTMSRDEALDNIGASDYI